MIAPPPLLLFGDTDMDIVTTRAFTLNREDGTSIEFKKGKNRDVSDADAGNWFVRMHLVGADPEAIANEMDAPPKPEPKKVA